MRIALISPVELKVPPIFYGGIERLIADLSEMPNVDVYGVPRSSKVKYYDEFSTDDYDIILDFTHQKYFQLMNKVIGVPFHPDPASSIMNMYSTKVLSTMYREPGIVIYPGISVNTNVGNDEDYLLFLGRITPYKDPITAIEVAKRLSMRIIIAGHTGRFADNVLVYKLRKMVGGNVELRENIDEQEKEELIRHATAVLIPSDWRILNSIESLGIVAMESMMMGTPIVTSGEGPCELLTNTHEIKYDFRGMGGYCCKPKDIDCFVRGVVAVKSMDRNEIRSWARRKYSVNRWYKDIKEKLPQVISS